MNRLISTQEAAKQIAAGKFLSLAAPEDVLASLPPGQWVGGTIPYFMDEAGGVVRTEGMVFVTELPASAGTRIAHYGAGELDKLVANGPDNGFSIAIVPAGSKAHQGFAENAMNEADALLKPTVGWVSGVHLSEIGQRSPKVFDGRTVEAHADGIMVVHVTLPPEQLASVEIVNIFEPGDGDILTFDSTSFQVGDCLINGERRNFAQYLAEHGLDDGKLPLVGDFGGARINVSIQSVNAQDQRVDLFAPVFTGVDYRFARPVSDYCETFRQRLENFDTGGVSFSCNCILNFLFGELEGRNIGKLCGPVTFGEIGYQLLNQTLVVLRIR
ncbi:hypothetical protein [Hydrogenophaga sp. 5NK40-0174]|uniref:DUF6976 family protein n=1 Tax=Hydrogenophaga sp. 5NK40-0174 TaxID=3127649 RepID=UPI00310801BE